MLSLKWWEGPPSKTEFCVLWPFSFPRTKLLILNFQVLSPMIIRTCKVRPLWCSKPNIMGICIPSADPLPGSASFCFFSLLVPVTSLSSVGSPVGPFSSQLHFYPSYPLDVVSSLYVVVESPFFQFLGCFLDVYTVVDVI